MVQCSNELQWRTELLSIDPAARKDRIIRDLENWSKAWCMVPLLQETTHGIDKYASNEREWKSNMRVPDEQLINRPERSYLINNINVLKIKVRRWERKKTRPRGPWRPESLNSVRMIIIVDMHLSRCSILLWIRMKKKTSLLLLRLTHYTLIFNSSSLKKLAHKNWEKSQKEEYYKRARVRISWWS